MNPSAEPKTAKSRATRSRILDALERLTLDLPLGVITTESVAREAELSVGSLYVHFETKDSMLYQLGVRNSEGPVERHKRRRAQLSPVERIAELGDVFVQLAGNPAAAKTALELHTPEFLRLADQQPGAACIADALLEWMLDLEIDVEEGQRAGMLTSAARSGQIAEVVRLFWRGLLFARAQRPNATAGEADAWKLLLAMMMHP